MLRLMEVASQSETFVKLYLEKSKSKNVNRHELFDCPAAGDTLEVFSLDRPPLLAVGRVLFNGCFYFRDTGTLIMTFDPKFKQRVGAFARIVTPPRNSLERAFELSVPQTVDVNVILMIRVVRPAVPYEIPNRQAIAETFVQVAEVIAALNVCEKWLVIKAAHLPANLTEHH